MFTRHSGYPITLVDEFLLPGLVPEHLKSILLIKEDKSIATSMSASDPNNSTERPACTTQALKNERPSYFHGEFGLSYSDMTVQTT